MLTGPAPPSVTVAMLVKLSGSFQLDQWKKFPKETASSCVHGKHSQCDLWAESRVNDKINKMEGKRDVLIKHMNKKRRVMFSYSR